MSKVERAIVYLTLVGMVFGGTATLWRIASTIDRRLSFLETCSAAAKESDDKLAKSIEDDIESVLDIIGDMEADAERLDRKVERFDQELRDAHVAAARSVGERFRFEEARLVHLWAEVDSIRADMAGIARNVQAVGRIAVRLDSVVYEMRLEAARRDSVDALPEPVVEQEKGFIRRLFRF